jgi:hypothetical protein
MNEDNLILSTCSPISGDITSEAANQEKRQRSISRKILTLPGQWRPAPKILNVPDKLCANAKVFSSEDRSMLKVGLSAGKQTSYSLKENSRYSK